jgi:hypothetical protein
VTTKLTGMDIIGEIIRDHYDLGEVKMPSQLENTHQRRHRKMVVESDAGKFLAKTYKTTRQPWTPYTFSIISRII